MSHFQNHEIKELFEEIDAEVIFTSKEKEHLIQLLSLADEKISYKLKQIFYIHIYHPIFFQIILVISLT